MTKIVTVKELAENIFAILEETFVQHHGIFLDKNTSLFETLETVTAEEASRPVSARCASIAAQVDHTRFYLDVLEGYMTGNPPEKVDWGEIWRTVGAVTPQEWDAIKNKLRESYERIIKILKGFEAGDSEGDIFEMLPIAVHTAYHLGEIRQALCTVRQG